MTPDEQLSARWRVGNRVKLNVYQGDRAAFQCHTPEEAARVVELLNIGESLFSLSVTSRTPIIEITEAFTEISAIREMLPEGDVVEGVRKIKRDLDIMESIARSGDQKQPFCEHECRFAFTDDGGKTGRCVMCSETHLRQERDQLRKLLRRSLPWIGFRGRSSTLLLRNEIDAALNTQAKEKP